MKTKADRELKGISQKAFNKFSCSMIIRFLTQANFNIFSFECIVTKAKETVKLPLYLSRWFIKLQKGSLIAQRLLKNSY